MGTKIKNHLPCSVDIPYIVDFPLGKSIKSTLKKPRFVANGYQKKVGQSAAKFECGQCSYRSMQRENSPIFRGKLRVEKGNYMKSKHSSENKVRKGKHVFPCRDKTVNDAAVHILTRPDPKRIHDAWEELKTL